MRLRTWKEGSLGGVDSAQTDSGELGGVAGPIWYVCPWVGQIPSPSSFESGRCENSLPELSRCGGVEGGVSGNTRWVAMGADEARIDTGCDVGDEPT